MGHEILGAIELEVVDLHRDRKLGDGIAEHQRVFKLALFVCDRELAEHFGTEVALTVVELGFGICERDLDLAELAVGLGIGRVIAEDVVVSDRRRGLHDATAEIVGVEQRLAAGVAGKRVERVLRGLKTSVAGLRGRARIHADVAGRALRRVAERSPGDQASCIDRPEGNARADGRVDRRVQLRLIVDAVQAQAAGEIDQGLLLAQLAKHLGRGLERAQLAVGVEDIELARVLPEGRASVSRARIVDRFGRPLAFADDHGFKNAEQAIAVGRKVLQHIDRAALIAQQRDEVGCGHLGANEFFSGRECANLIRRPHRAHIEIERKQPVIFVPGFAVAFGRDGGAGQTLIDL